MKMKNNIIVLTICISIIHSSILWGAAGVVVQKITAGDIKDTLKFSGEVKPIVESIITADVSGRVEKILVENGDYVKEGAPVIILERERYEIALRNAQSILEMAAQKEKETSRDLRRNRLLAEKKVVNEKVFDIVETNFINAQNTHRQAQAAVELAKLNLERTSIKSAISGYFVSRQVFLGQGITPGVPLGRIIDLKKVFVDVKIPENQIGLIKNGQISTIEEKTKGKVAHIDLYADSSRSFQVKIVVDNTDLAYKANMFVKGEIVLNQFQEVPLIPISALISEDGKNYVYIADNAKANKKPVKIIAREGNFAYVQGVEAGESLIIVGQGNLSDGMEITVAEKS